MEVGSLFSLSGPDVATAMGKLPGMENLDAIDGRMWRRLAWPGEEPKPDGETLPKLIVWSLRKVNVPGTAGDRPLLCSLSVGGDSARWVDRSGY